MSNKIGGIFEEVIEAFRMGPEPALQSLPIDQIIRRTDARALNEASVASLADSIGSVGLINPIRVREKDGRWEVTAGSHRLAACERLGLADIECIVVTDDDLHSELAMIDENLCRNELSPAERASQTARRKAIYLELHPETRVGENQHTRVRQLGEGSEAADRFTSETASATGKSERVVQRDAERGTKVIGEVIDMITGTKLDTGSYLDKLKRLSPNDQVSAARRDLANDKAREREHKRQAAAKARATLQVARTIVMHVPREYWDAITSDLRAAGASNIAKTLANVISEGGRDAE